MIYKSLLTIGRRQCMQRVFAKPTFSLSDHASHGRSFRTMNGVIWSKTQKTFVPISSVPAYATLQRELVRQSRALEIHNFQLQNLTLTSFQQRNFLQFYDNNTRITGLCGDLWTILSDILNFTLQPIRANVDGLGAPTKNHTYNEGLLGIIFRNETDVIPMVETYSSRLVAADFTTPLWFNSYRLYIRDEGIYDSTWMTKVFSWEIWCVILVMYVLLNACSFGMQTIVTKIRNKRRLTTIGDHLFYNFGMLCNQSYIPEIFDGRSRILEMSLGLFCLILSIAFGALLFIYMTKRIVIPPFNDLESLLSNTKYNIVSMKGSIIDIAVQVSTDESFTKVREAKRFVAASKFEEIITMMCSSKKNKYVLFQSEDEHKTTKNLLCNLTPAGRRYLTMWISAGIVKDFKYKRTIDIGILRLMEVGLWKGLKDRWLMKKIEHKANKPEGVRIDQISLVLKMMCYGTILAFIIFIIEVIVFTCKHKNINRLQNTYNKTVSVKNLLENKICL